MILWIGKEKEGMYHGMNTLFIGSPKITYNQIEEIVLKTKNLEQLYFGAGRCTPINQKVVKECLKYFGKFLVITLEIDITKLYKYEVSLLKRVNVLVTINTENLNVLRGLSRDLTQIKVQCLTNKSKDILIFPIGEYSKVNTSLLKEKTYKGDRVIL
jgi:hypothetical protein